MVISKLLSKSKLSKSTSRRYEVAEIDRLLDVPAGRFTEAARTLARKLRRGRHHVNVAGFRQRREVSVTKADPVSQPDVRGGFYQVELRRIPPMDRDEEFRMARRYEFMKLRAQLEFEALGLRADLARELAGKPRSEIARAVGDPNGYLDACLLELEDLRNLYVEGALHIVLGTVARYRGLGVDTPDLIQEGNASLFQAIEGFDWRRDVRFRTYAQYWVQQAVLKMLYNSARTVRIPIWVQKLLGKIRRIQDDGRRAGREIPNSEIAARLGLTEEKVSRVLDTKRYAVSLDAQVGEDGSPLVQLLPDESTPGVPDSVPAGDLQQSLAAAMDDLPDRERLILRRRFGLGGSEPETLGDIAVDLGITAERVRQLQNAALSRLQRPVKLRQLAAFVESA
jgi:DNA-directed RNA polymerase sigma subunit (sigma70/sigma32)